MKNTSNHLVYNLVIVNSKFGLLYAICLLKKIQTKVKSKCKIYTYENAAVIRQRLLFSFSAEFHYIHSLFIMNLCVAVLEKQGKVR